MTSSQTNIKSSSISPQPPLSSTGGKGYVVGYYKSFVSSISSSRSSSAASQPAESFWIDGVGSFSKKSKGLIEGCKSSGFSYGMAESSEGAIY